MDFLTLVSDVCGIICAYTSLKRGIRAVLSLLVDNLSLEGACLFLTRGRVYVWPDDVEFHEYRMALEGGAVEGMEVVPLPKMRGEGRGYLVVRRKRVLSSEEKRLLEVVARQLAQFLRHVRIQKELKAGARLLLDLYSAGRELGSVLDRKELAQKLAEYAREFSGADLVNITLFEGEGKHSSLALFVGKEDGDIIKFYNEGLYRRVVVPLATTKGNWGVLEFYLPREATFSRHQKRVIHILAELAGTFLENITLYDRLKFLLEEREKRIRFLSILYQVGNAYRWTSELRKRFFLALRALTDPQKGLGLPEAYFFIRDEAKGVLKGVMGISWSEVSPWGDQDWTVDEEYIGRIEGSPAFRDLKDVVPSGPPWNKLERGEVVYLCHGSTLPFMNEGMVYVVFPLMAGDNLVGAILVGKEGGFDSEEVHFLTMFSHQLALAVESARLQEVLKVTGRELKEAQERFLHSEKLAALGELAARVAHDLKNPLVAIGGFARRLHEKMAEDCPDKVYTGTILKEVEEAEKILSNVLGYARVPSLRKRFADINSLLDDVLFLHAEEMRDRNIALVKKLDRSLPPVSIDPAQMRQVFMNLVSNALQAIRKKGSIAVSTSKEESNGREYVKVEISDTGGGIPEDVLPNIFNPFFTTKSTGTGLGLSIVKRIVELHGGEIRVVNNPPIGATFVIYLPLGEEGEGSDRSS